MNRRLEIEGWHDAQWQCTICRLMFYDDLEHGDDPERAWIRGMRLGDRRREMRTWAAERRVYHARSRVGERLDEVTDQLPEDTAPGFIRDVTATSRRPH